MKLRSMPSSQSSCASDTGHRTLSSRPRKSSNVASEMLMLNARTVIVSLAITAGGIHLQTAGEEAVEHPIGQQPGCTDNRRGAATDRIAGARSLDGDRVGDDASDLVGARCVRRGRKGL